MLNRPIRNKFFFEYDFDRGLTNLQRAQNIYDIPLYKRRANFDTGKTELTRIIFQ